MRRMVAVMSILGVFGLSGATSAQPTTRPQGTQTTLKISGMACGACAATVERLVKKVDGVTGAVASQPTGTAEITFDPAKTSAVALAKIINEKTSFKAELASSHAKKNQ